MTGPPFPQAETTEKDSLSPSKETVPYGPGGGITLGRLEMAPEPTAMLQPE